MKSIPSTPPFYVRRHSDGQFFKVGPFGPLPSSQEDAYTSLSIETARQFHADVASLGGPACIWRPGDPWPVDSPDLVTVTASRRWVSIRKE